MKTGVNLHLHTNDDPVDKIGYSFIEALDKSKELGIFITALTTHNKYIDYPEYREEAKKRGMLFIPGIERTIEHAHVLILNADKDTETICSLEALRAYKSMHPECFIIAAHPWMPIHSLRERLITYSDIFDAIEFTWFYSKLINPNRKAERDAKVLHLPLIATADAHKINFIEKGFAGVEVEDLSIPAVFAAIRARKFTNITKPQTTWSMITYVYEAFFQTRYK
jgi:predicted metal-dependent phosphoesterase TrpH